MCVIDYQNKIIYIAIPKTGSTSTEIFLKCAGSKKSMIQSLNVKNDIGLDKHATALQIKHAIEDYDKFYKIAVVRNPYDWYVSWYMYRKREEAAVSSKNMTLKQYLLDQPMDDMMDWITDENDNVIVDTIIKYEDNIEDVMIKALENHLSIDSDCVFPHINVSNERKSKDYTQYYDDDTRQLVLKLQNKMIKYFGYEY